jgi:hypothetical protein
LSSLSQVLESVRRGEAEEADEDFTGVAEPVTSTGNTTCVWDGT